MCLPPVFSSKRSKNGKAIDNHDCGVFSIVVKQPEVVFRAAIQSEVLCQRTSADTPCTLS